MVGKNIYLREKFQTLERHVFTHNNGIIIYVCKLKIMKVAPLFRASLTHYVYHKIADTVLFLKEIL